MPKVLADRVTLAVCIPALLSLCVVCCSRTRDDAARVAPPSGRPISTEVLADRLLKAIEAYEIDAVRSALREGADPNGPGLQLRVLGQAIRAHDPAVVRELIKAGADVNATTTEGSGLPMVALAAFYNEPAIVKMLVQAGAKPDARSKQGMTALAEAAVANASLVCEPLVEAGADINGWALWPSHIYAGEIQTTPPKRGRTPLMIAASMGNLKAVHALLLLGADARLKNERGESAIDLIGEEDNPIQEIHSLLSTPSGLSSPRR